MDGSKIPKAASGLKPPTKINMPLSHKAISKPLASISEFKISKTTSISSCQKTDEKISFQRPNALRRRSKSITDLRPLTSKPITALRPTTKTNVLPNDKAKAAQKRPLKNDEEIKPKVPKMKIPDWDYKSRFQELQKKHGSLLEDFKASKTKLSDLKNLEEELQNLQEDKINKQMQITSLQAERDNLKQEKEALHIENIEIKTELSQLYDSHANLKKQHDCLMEENNINLKKINDLLKTCSQTQSELQVLTSKHKELHDSHENLKNKYNCLMEENNANLKKLDELQKAHLKTLSELQELIGKNKHLESVVELLKQTVEEHETLRRVLHNNIQDLKGNIRVFCRVRPPIRDEEDKLLCSVVFPDENSLEIRKSRESVSTITGRPTDLKQEFSFDKVFPPEASQSEVFEELSQLVQSALDGYHVCVFAYGQTGSGKTFTMQGSPQDYGMIPRTIDAIFEQIEKLKLSGWNYKVTASFLEIYNENVRDLLEPNSSYNYELRYNEGRGVTITNLRIMSISTASDLKMIMDEAHKNRAVAATDFNLHSSRSHAVTKIHLKGFNENSKITYRGSINLVDLAGSESAKTSAADRLTETKNINKSLSTLGNVMLALHNKDSHVPYRNSKLTFLLQSCLGGNSKTLMFVNISPFEECFGESISSLRFAAKVKDIKTHARKNKGCLTVPPLLSSKSTL